MGAMALKEVFKEESEEVLCAWQDDRTDNQPAWGSLLGRQQAGVLHQRPRGQGHEDQTGAQGQSQAKQRWWCWSCSPSEQEAS